MSVGILLLILFIAMLTGAPIALGIGATCLIFLYHTGFDLFIFVQRIYSALDSTTLLALPGFIIAGNLMASGGLAKRLVAMFEMLVAKLPGGLAMCNIVACSFFGTISGSSVATVAAIGGIMMPEMEKRGYSKSFTAATSAAGGILGGIIPPSMGIVMYGCAVGVSIASLFKAGITVGIFMTLAAIVITIIYGKKYNLRFPNLRYTPKEKVVIIKDAMLALLTPIIILGGIFSGILTPTESAVAAIIYSYIIGKFVYKEITMNKLIKILINSAVTSSAILIIAAFSNIFGWIVSVARVPQAVLEVLTAVSESSFVIMSLIIIFLLIAGMFEAGSAIIYICGPVLAPIGVAIGMDPIQFGTIFLTAVAIGMLTPPFGQCLYVSSMLSGAPVQSVARQLIPFIIAYIFCVFIQVVVPIALILL